MVARPRNISEQMYRKLYPLRASFLDNLEENEKRSIVYPRKLSEERKKEIIEILE